jgi:methionine sulfoxide reductase heme-binding subunit
VDQALWFTSRATGLVSLLLITATAVLGASHAGRATSARWPRFTVHAVHRNLSLLTLAFLVVHIATAVIDPYVKIGWIDTVVPFVSAYQPFWLGLGAVAFDLVIAVLVTSIMRLRVPRRVWRLVHVSTYAMWPVAVIHGLGIGGDDSSMWWVIALNVGCTLAVAVALTRRLLVRDPDAQARRAVELGVR